MIEALLGILAALFEILLAIAEPVITIIFGILSLDESMGENSRLGESPLAREGRRDWRNYTLGCLGLLLLVTAASAFAWWCLG
ncbi:hypothetical protein [Prosthecobacter sp.]|uniref:hypothetical protein n=1 Tax=Prosthecobacter sp. TaxID=1965333 RepID=UPI003783C56F